MRINNTETFNIGDIIEFKDKKEGGEDGDCTYVDRISTINYFDDGKVSYWTELYPELNGVDPEISEERIVDCCKKNAIENKDPLNLVFPYKSGQLISFNWDDGKPRVEGHISEIYFVIDDRDISPDLRIIVQDEKGTGYSLCQEDFNDHDIRVNSSCNHIRTGFNKNNWKLECRACGGSWELSEVIKGFLEWNKDTHKKNL